MQIILGKGQVANAISELLKDDVVMYDKGEWENKHLESDVVNICFPYSDEFKNLLEKATEKGKFVVIHSTVKPDLDMRNVDLLYSPVTGRHDDDFASDIKNRVKFFAGDRYVYEKNKHYFDLETEYWGENKNELAYAKVMSTNYMYWNLVYEKALYNECQKHGYDHNKVYKRWNRMYNKGQEWLHPEWKRSIYDHVEDKKAGGHCLPANIHLVDNEITKILKEWESV